MAQVQYSSGHFCCKTYPGTGKNYTDPNNWKDAFQGPDQAFSLVSISQALGVGNPPNVPFTCNANTSVATGGVLSPASYGVNNGTVTYTFTNNLVITATSGGVFTCTVMWSGSEQGVCLTGGGGNPQPSLGGTNSYDLWRFNLFFQDNATDNASNQRNLIRISTAIPNAPVISIPTQIQWN